MRRANPQRTGHRPDDLPNVHACITIHDGSSMVFVKTVVYHAWAL